MYNPILTRDFYNNLRFSGAGIWNQNAAVDVNGNLIIDAGRQTNNSQLITVGPLHAQRICQSTVHKPACALLVLR